MTHLTASFVGVGVAPTLSSVVALTATSVRVTFSEAMLVGSGVNVPGNYTITEDLGSNAVTATSLSVSSGLNVVTLFLDGPMTAGTNNYNLAVPGTFTDLAGNLIDPPLNLDFNGIGADVVTPSVVPTEVENTGGYRLELAISVDDGLYNIHLGPNGDATDPLCFSGIPGQGYECQVRDNAVTVFSPALPVGGPYEFTLVNLETAAVTVTTGLVDVRYRLFRSSIYDLRRRFSTKWKTGKTRIDYEAYPQ